MEADWFADPLERYEGRFFDGANWTDQVSDKGVLGIDPEWPPTEHAGTETDPVDVTEVATASVLIESPVRVVAIVDRAALAETAAGDSTPHSRRRRRWYMAALVTALVAMVAATLLFRPSTDPPDDVVQGAPTSAALDAGTSITGPASATPTMPATPVDEAAPSPTEKPTPIEVDAAPLADGGDLDELEPGDALAVGGLQLVNGRTVLTELAVWHDSFAARRGLELGPDASCWFGRLGSAAAQNAFCGPVGGAADTAWLFDLVPLVFEDRGQGLIARPIVDATAIDTALPNGLELVGPVDPPTQLPERGERESGG